MEQNNHIIKKGIWQSLLDALKGTEADYTNIPLKRAIFLLSIPMILELIMESIFAIVDIYFVGKLGKSAVAAVGLTETYLFIIYSIAIGLSTGVIALVARRIGEKNKEKAGLIGGQAIILSILISIPIAIIGIVYAYDLLKLMGADDWALKNGINYTRWLIGGNTIIMLIFVINGIFRGAGDAVIAMRVLWISNIINIVLDPILINQLGLDGAAIATNIGRGTGVLIQLYYLFVKGGKRIRVLKQQLLWYKEIIISIVKTSLGGIFQMFISMSAWIFLVRILADEGSEAVAASTIVVRILMFTLMPAWGFSNAAGTLVGQCLGANNPDRAEKSVWLIGIYNMIYLIGISIIYFIFSEQLMMIFTTEEEVIKIGAEWIQILSYAYFVYGWWMVSVQAFNGAGDTLTPTYINIFFFWLLQIPLAYILAQTFNWGYLGVFWSVFISETSVGIFTLYLFTRGKWKTKKV